MGYSGEALTSCGSVNLNFSSVYIIVVSGDGPNVCGHMLLNIGGRQGSYFHAAEIRDYPRYMNAAGYTRYLSVNGKSERGRYFISLPNPQEARLHLEELTSKPWLWLVLPNNCVHFVEEVIQAGGADFGLVSNCPEFLVKKREVESFINRELNDRAIERRIWQFQRWSTGGQ